jgi:hypothetical protein
VNLNYEAIYIYMAQKFTLRVDVKKVHPTEPQLEPQKRTYKAFFFLSKKRLLHIYGLFI